MSWEGGEHIEAPPTPSGSLALSDRAEPEDGSCCM